MWVKINSEYKTQQEVDADAQILRVEACLSQKLKLSPSEELYLRFKATPLAFGMSFFPQHFPLETPDFHIIILNEAIEERYLAVASPRESAKSTILAFLYPAHCIAFKERRFIVLISNTYKKAAMSLEAIKKELKDNQNFKEYFKIEVTKDAEGDTIFRHTDGFETRFLCKGVEQIGAIRGEKFGAYRPDLIIGDDMEDDELVRNPERRLQLQDEFDEALIPAGDKERCKFIFIGTILHDNSQMAKLVSKDNYKEFRKLLFKAKILYKDGRVESLWDNKWTIKDLGRLEAEKPSVFAKEYQNDPVSGAQARFHKEDFRYWTFENMRYVLFDDQGRITSQGNIADCKAGIACDLAWEEKRENDFSVIMPGFLTPTSDILIETYICKKGLRPHEMEEILFLMDERLRSLTKGYVPIGFEKAKLEKVMQYLLKEAMRRRNKFLSFVPLVWDGDKITRAETRLEPRYNQHTIYHRRDMGELEHQLIRFPSGTHDDLVDAAQGLVQILQFPKAGKKIVQEDDEFMWWRKKAIEYHHPEKAKKHPFVFGRKQRSFGVPATESYR